jgi:hypothetical protein
MGRRDDSEMVLLGALLLGALAALRWRALDAARSAFEPVRPEGESVPERGDLREVPAVATPLAPWSGVVDLYARALQAVDDLAEPLVDWLHTHEIVELQRSMPSEASDDYRQAAEVFAAHAAVETDSGRSVYHYNLGNLTVNRGPFYYNPKVRSKALRFGVYGSPEEGAIAHVARVHRLWPEAWKAAFVGSLHGYAAGLQTGPRVYAGGVSVSQLERVLRAQAEAHGYELLG